MFLTSVSASPFDRGIASACSGTKDEKPAANAAPSPAASAAAPAATGTPASDADASLPEATSPYDALPEAIRNALDKPFTGDFDAQVARRLIRVGVTFNRTHYFIDKGEQRGLTYESVKLFEDDLNKDHKTGNLKVNVVFVPLPRDQLYPALINGKVDMVAAMVTVTPEREKLVAFSDPTRTNVNEVVVTAPGAAPIATLDDLPAARCSSAS
jgi:ABC-type amino acid transport substrate-binding protein